MLKVLIIPGFRLYPIDSGGAHAQLAFLEKLQYQQQVDLLIRPENIEEKDLPSFQARFPQLNLLRAGYSAAAPIQKISALIKKIGKKMVGNDPSYQLRKYGFLNALIRTRPDVLDEIQRLARDKKYDIIQVEQAINLGMIELLPAGPKKVFVHHEISHSRIHNDMLSRGNQPSLAGQVSGIVWQLEKNWLQQYDGIITLSLEDADLLRSRGISKPIQVAEAFALFEHELKQVYDPSLPPHLLFVGGESHYPNKEGLSWFLKEVFPLVRQQQPGTVIKITGSWSEEFKQQFSADPAIQFIGFIPSLEKEYHDSILIAPVRIGSGVRIKVITALAHGAPVVGTTLGVSGIPGIVHERNALIADNEKQFAQYLISVLQNADLRSQLSEKGFQLAQKGYANAAFANDRGRFYMELTGGSSL